jgi:hypothetical protein
VIATITAHLSECPPAKCDFRGLTTGAGAVWVTTARTSVLRIDPATNQVTDTIRLGPCCSTLRGVAVGFGSVWAAVDGLGNVIARIDLQTLAVTALIPSVQANHSEITIFDKQVWIGHDSNTHSIIEAIDPATNQTRRGRHRRTRAQPASHGPYPSSSTGHHGWCRKTLPPSRMDSCRFTAHPRPSAPGIGSSHGAVRSPGASTVPFRSSRPVRGCLTLGPLGWRTAAPA